MTVEANRYKSLSSKKVDFALTLPEFKQAAEEAIHSIQQNINLKSTEADVVHNFELNTAIIFRDILGIDYAPRKEQTAHRSRISASGRIDSRIGNVLIEFKRPYKLASDSEVTSAKNQLHSYLETIALEPEQIAIGYLTDGIHILRMYVDSDGIMQSGSLVMLSVESYIELIKDIVSLDRTRLTATSLVESFAPKDGPLFSLSRTLYDTLQNDSLGRTQMLFKEWQLLFKLAHDDQSKQKAIDARRAALAEVLNIRLEKGDNESEYAALFAIQTAYAIVLKLIASHLLNSVRETNVQSSFESLIMSSGDILQMYMARLEDGAVFRDEGFENLLEGDFFSWYSDSRQWTENVHNDVVKVLQVLTRYENTTALGKLNTKAMDLFKDLYMSVIPEKVRHNLGEFYTPPWLADHTLITAQESRVSDDSASWRGLDPCCGSGTFLTAMIRHVLVENVEKNEEEQLNAVLRRVVGIDLNPLAVLTARINYFINIAHLIQADSAFEIPVYLGDASKLPNVTEVDNVVCVNYTIKTLKGDLSITLPSSIVEDTDKFSKVMTECEFLTKRQEPDEIAALLESLCRPSDLTHTVRQGIISFSNALVDLEKQEWNGIWPRIVANFLTTSNLGKFDLIVGNPPWIDWKNLPEHYRNSLVEVCVDRRLFSGAGRTGGINLNICALITHVAANAWLASDGVLAFLMPEPLIFQKSYEGFRKFEDTGNGQFYLRGLVDWTESGHPFAPVTQPFLTYVIGARPADYTNGIPVSKIRKSSRRSLSNFADVTSFDEIRDQFAFSDLVATRPSGKSTAFAYAQDSVQAKEFQALSGEMEYRGRDGLQLYPEDLFLFSFNGRVRNMSGIQNASFLTFEKPSLSSKSIRTEHILETRYMRPVVKGTEIDRFRWAGPAYFAPLPYDVTYASGRSPLPPNELHKTSPKLLRYFINQEGRFGSQSSYNKRIVGEKHHTEFYSFTRVGAYTHASTFVAFRHNTKWAATVIESVVTPWGAESSPVFQSHALSISEGPNGFISTDEAHYLCAALNAPVVQKYIYQSSDLRSFKVQPQLNIPVFDPEDPMHMALSAASVRAHRCGGDSAVISHIDAEIDALLLEVL